MASTVSSLSSQAALSSSEVQALSKGPSAMPFPKADKKEGKQEKHSERKDGKQGPEKPELERTATRVLESYLGSASSGSTSSSSSSTLRSSSSLAASSSSTTSSSSSSTKGTPSMSAYEFKLTEDGLDELDELNAVLEQQLQQSLVTPGAKTTQGGSRGSKGSSKRRAAAVDETDGLTQLELKVFDWCSRGGLPFRRVHVEDDRVTEDHKENALNYLDAFTEQAMRAIQEKNTKGPEETWNWILQFSIGKPMFPAHRAYVVAKRACIEFDTDPKRNLKNKTRRAELITRTQMAEKEWLREMARAL